MAKSEKGEAGARRTRTAKRRPSAEAEKVHGSQKQLMEEVE